MQGPDRIKSYTVDDLEMDDILNIPFIFYQYPPLPSQLVLSALYTLGCNKKLKFVLLNV